MTSAEPLSDLSGPARARGSPLGSAIRTAIVLVLFGGLAVALGGGWERLQEYEWEFEAWAVAASFAVMLLASVWGAVAWFAVARAFGARIAARPALRIYATSNLGKYLPGKVWHAFARVYLAQQDGVPVALATTIVVTDIVLYVAAGLLVMLVALPNIAQSLGIAGGPIMMAAAVAGLLGGLAMLHPAALNASFRLAGRLMPRRTFPPIEASYATILRIFVLYLVLWSLNAVALFAGLQAVGQVSLAVLPTVGAMFALSYLSGLVMPLAPAGLGVREGLMALLLSQLVPVPAAAAASVLIRVLQVAAEGLCAAAFSRI